jgi:hypothetical protein
MKEQNAAVLSQLSVKKEKSMSEAEKNWERLLKEGEKLLWTGKPSNIQTVDPANRISFIAEISIAVLWIIFSSIKIIPQCDTVASMIIVELVPVILLLLPLLNVRSLKKAEYALTDKRAIVKIGEDFHYMEYDAYTPCEKKANNTVCIGAAVGTKDIKERKVLLYHGVQDPDKKCVGLLFYTTTDADKAMEILSGKSA